MRKKIVSFELFIFLVSFVFLSLILHGQAFADCNSPFGEPGKGCCVESDPDLYCCATPEDCNQNPDPGYECVCNTGNHCDLAPPSSMLYKVCIPDDIECGEQVGQPCCEEAGVGGSIWVCNDQKGLACNFDTQKCESCGSQSQICCNNSTKCNSGLECNNGRCTNIGNDPVTDCNEPDDICCYNWGSGGNTCEVIDTVPPSFEDCYCEGDLTCTLRGSTGYCTNPDLCGGMNEICCTLPLPPCDTGLDCSPTLNICGNYDDPPPRPPEMVYTGPVIESLQDLLGPVTKMLYYGGLAIGVFFIILAGYKLMVSEGDPQRTKAAQEQLTTAIIGIIFILLSITILRVIINQIIGENI